MKNTKPKISFVVPVYNKEAYVAQCLQSLQAQTIENIEVVVVNDGSTDGSLEVINYFIQKDSKRFRLIKLDNNIGRSEARNLGNLRATADIIAVQDADDTSLPQRAEKILQAFKKNNADVVFSSFYTVNQFLEPMEEIRAIQFDIARAKKDRYNYIGHSTMAYKKYCSDKVKYRAGDISDLGIDDWMFQLELWKAGYKFFGIEKVLVNYRVLSNTISGTRSAEDVTSAKDRAMKELGLI